MMLNHCLRRLRSLSAEERGVTRVEYAIIAALLALMIIGSVSLLGSSASTMFSTAANTI